MTQEDVLYRIRLRTMALGREMGNVRAACRVMGIHPSTYYRWRRQLVRYGVEALRPRERRVPRMPNAFPPILEHKILAFAGIQSSTMVSTIPHPLPRDMGALLRTQDARMVR